MKSRLLMLLGAIVALFAALAIPLVLVAQEPQAPLLSNLTTGKAERQTHLEAAGLASLPSEAQASVLAQLAKLTASDGAPFDYMGYSVAISGNTVVVGAWLATIGSNPLQGAAYVFVKPASGWTNMTEVAKLTASDGAAGDKLGFSVSISGDTVVAGAPAATVDSNFAQGAAYVFVKPATGWVDMTETAKLTASDGQSLDSLGWSVSISGNTVVAGEPGPLIAGGVNAGQAAAYVFVKPATGWTNMTQTAELTGSDTVLSDEFGFSVSTSGSVAVVGARSATTSGFSQFQGAAYVFVQSGSGWANMTQTAKLTASDGAYAAYLGTSVSISGNTVVAGAPGAGTSRGAAYVFTRPEGGWANMKETAELTGGLSGDLLGYSVATNGEIVAAGAPRWPAYNGSGAAYVFVKSKNGWKSTSNFSAKLAASDGAVNDYFGFSVDISGDTIVSGAYGAAIGSNSQQGAAYIFGGSHLLDALARPARPVVEVQQKTKEEHTRYKLIDLGTFGGPESYFSSIPSQNVNNRGVAAGYADTSTPDPFPSFCLNPDCYVSHAFQWHDGSVTDLGALPEGGSSQTLWISANGLVAGISQNGQTDPLIPGFPELRAVLWQNGNIVDLGTLEEGYESLAFAVNNGGQVVGPAFNTIPDDFCLFATGFCTTQTRAFLWENGVMQDLGTLGGPDAFALAIDDSATVLGFSYTSYNPGPTGVPPIDPFLWHRGKMIDLGTLGGTAGFPNAFNTHRQVVGQSNLAGDTEFRPFLWQRGVMTALGTFLGPGHPSDGVANSLNDAGVVVGWADNQNNDYPALWKNGVTTNLGTVGGDSCAYANSINSKGQVVGNSGVCLTAPVHAFLWEEGGPLVDLNTLVPSSSGVQLTNAISVNNNGTIAATGLVANGNQHAFLLIPCDENQPRVERCDYSMVDAPAAPQMTPAVHSPSSLVRPSLMRRMNRYRFPGFAIGPSN